MHILLTNDDGIFAPGLAAMYKHLTALGKVTVAAPSDVRSGCSHSISLRSISCEKVQVVGLFTGYSIDGTPADCVKLALNGLIDLEKQPVDLVVSGINYGANVGIHVYYSGTVAAAMEAAFHGIPAIAMSAAYESPIKMEDVASYCLPVIRRLLPLENGQVINVNIPRLTHGKPKGITVVPHALAGFREGYTIENSENNQQVFTSTGYPLDIAETEGTDANRLSQGYITVSALRLNMNDAQRNEQLARQLGIQ